MVSIDAALSCIKDDWRAVLSVSHIEAVCRGAGLKWRKRLLDPVTTLLFFLPVLHRNTAISNLPRLAGRRFTPGAYCQAPACVCPRRCWDSFCAKAGSSACAGVRGPVTSLPCDE